MKEANTVEPKKITRRQLLKLIWTLFLGSAATAVLAGCGIETKKSAYTPEEMADLTLEQLQQALPANYRNCALVLYEHLQLAKMLCNISQYMDALQTQISNSNLSFVLQTRTAYDLLINGIDSSSSVELDKESESTSLVNKNCQIICESETVKELELDFSTDEILIDLGILSNFLPAKIKLVDSFSGSGNLDNAGAMIDYNNGGIIEILVSAFGSLFIQLDANGQNRKVFDYPKVIGVLIHELGHWLERMPKEGSADLKAELIALKLKFTRLAIQEWLPQKDQDKNLGPVEKFFTADPAWSNIGSDKLTDNQMTMIALIAEVGHKLLDSVTFASNPIIKKYAQLFQQEREKILKRYLER